MPRKLNAEYGTGGTSSTKGDVYSYGIMPLELFTGKTPTHPTFVGELSLQKWVISTFPTTTMQVVDPEMHKIDPLHYVRPGDKHRNPTRLQSFNCRGWVILHC